MRSKCPMGLHARVCSVEMTAVTVRFCSISMHTPTDW